MKIYDSLPQALEGRGQQNSVAIRCDCGIDFIWPVMAGNDVRCPSCGNVQTLPVDQAKPLTPITA